MKVRHNFKNSNISCIHTIPDTRYEHPVFFTGRLIFINIQAQQLMCYKVFLLLAAWKSVREPILSLHCFWGAGPSCCEGKTLPVKSIFQTSGRQPLLGSPEGLFGFDVRDVWICRLLERQSQVQHADTGSPNAKIELRENRWELRIVDNLYASVVLGHGDGMEVRVWQNLWAGKTFGGTWASGGQTNPRLHSPPPALPQTLFLVAWSIPRRSSPGTGWGAALLLHCEGSGLHLGRSETQRIRLWWVRCCFWTQISSTLGWWTAG